MRLPLALLILAACTPQAPYEPTVDEATRYAELRCDAMATCCEAPPANCVEHYRNALLDLQDLTPSPLTYSDSCMQEILEWLPTTECGTWQELEGPDCTLVHGERQHGEPCIYVDDLGLLGTDCAPGLQCFGDVCLDDPLFLDNAPLGGVCGFELGWSCHLEHYCSPAGICEPRASEGEPCSSGTQCLADPPLYCAGLSTAPEGTCQPRPVLGEPCIAEEDACDFHRTESGGTAVVCTDSLCAFPEYGPVICEPDPG